MRLMRLRAAVTLLPFLCLSVAGDNEEPVNVLDGGVVASDDATTTRSVKKSGGNAVVDVSKPLWSQAACKEELKAFECPADEAKDNNFVAVLCLTTRGTTRQAAEEAAEDPSRAGSLSSKAVLSDECQHVIWQYKKAITNDANVLRRLRDSCRSEEDSIVLKECSEGHVNEQLKADSLHNGHVLSCMVEKKSGAGDETGRPIVFSKPCSRRVTEIEMVAFSDYRLVGTFVDACAEDVSALSCGRVELLGNKPSYLSQGKVIECLSRNLADLHKDCLKETLRVAEYQSDDYHLDRSLFLACQNDRQHLCAKVKSGDGRVYSCLMAQKMHPEMSKTCRGQLIRRQQMMSRDYRVSYGLAKACKLEITENGCRKGVNKNEEGYVRASQILICLEGVINNEQGTVNGACVAQMREHRQMLMEDFNVSPEIVVECRDEVRTKCAGVPGERTIHCLMKYAVQRQLDNERCEHALSTLLREADVASDWKVDPVLHENCSPVVSSACDSKAPNEVVLSCLMSLAAKNSRHMTNECMTTLLEIQYFLSRDFRLDTKLYRGCRDDAEQFCNASHDWHTEDDAKSRLVFPCLVRYLYGPDADDGEDDDEKDDDNAGAAGSELSERCADQVERVLEQRAISVKLHPDIEDACRPFLVQKCVKHTRPGEELQCLQDNLDELDEDCRNTVNDYTRLEAKNTRLNTAVAIACRDIIEDECKGEAAEVEEGRLMRCLIEFKTENRNSVQRMTGECSGAVEHWQILAMKNWHFSPAFRKACQKDVRKNCNHPKGKADIMQCLVAAIEADMLDIDRKEGQPNNVSAECKAELKFELLQKHSNVKLNPSIKSNCKEELNLLCREDRTLECLKAQKHSELSQKCRSAVFLEEKEEVYINRADGVLMRTCENEISRHCHGRQAAGTPNAIFNCLKENKDDADFDPNCRKLVVKRIVQQMRDYRLNPRLMKSCRHDLPKFCSSIMMPESKDYNPIGDRDFYEGKVISCLKDSFAQGKPLTKKCQLEIENVMRSATVDIRANPVVVAACPRSIAYCTNKNSQKDDSGKVVMAGDKIEECLKGLFHDKMLIKVGDTSSCRQELAKLIEASRMDVDSDVPLKDACSVDLSKFCREISESHSRGEKISCLRNVLEDKHLKLEPRCEKLMRQRLELYREAVEVVPIHDMRDLYAHLYNSPNRGYIALVILGIIGAIFTVGILFGRVSKRQRREMKLK